MEEWVHDHLKGQLATTADRPARTPTLHVLAGESLGSICSWRRRSISIPCPNNELDRESQTVRKGQMNNDRDENVVVRYKVGIYCAHNIQGTFSLTAQISSSTSRALINTIHYYIIYPTNKSYLYLFFSFSWCILLLIIV